MTLIRLLEAFRFHHHELPVGETIAVRDELAHRLQRLGIAEFAEPLKAIVMPEETRLQEPMQTRGRGRPPKQREMPA